MWAASLFTEDVELLFPVGSHQGLTGADGFLREIMERWDRTHHHGSLASVEPDGDLAAVSWSLIASHVHFGSPLPPQPSAILPDRRALHRRRASHAGRLAFRAAAAPDRVEHRLTARRSDRGRRPDP
ncbi:hypothetical protein SMICM17S_10633 [Streptomyces microflavus]